MLPAENPGLTFNQFLTIFFRLSVVFFDINYKSTAPTPAGSQGDYPLSDGGSSGLNRVPNYKKLISLLSRVELTQGYSQFIGKLRVNKAAGHKVYQTSLTPPKHILMQLYLNE